MQSVLKAIKEEIQWKLRWIRETRVHTRQLLEENPGARVGHIKAFIRREQEELILLRRARQILLKKP